MMTCKNSTQTLPNYGAVGLDKELNTEDMLTNANKSRGQHHLQETPVQTGSSSSTRQLGEAGHRGRGSFWKRDKKYISTTSDSSKQLPN